MYLDLAFIIVVLVFTLIGLWRGFFKTLLGFFGALVSIVIAIFLAEKIADALLGTTAFQKMILGETGSLSASIFKIMPEALKNITIGANDGSVQAAIANTFLKPFLESIASYVQNIDPSVSPETTLAMCLSLIVARYVFILIVGIVLFLVIRILVVFLSIYFNSLVKGEEGKQIRKTDRVIGAVFGAMQGFVIACAAFFVISAFNGANFMADVNEQLDKSVISKPVAEQVGELSDKYLNGYDDQLNDLLKKAGIIPESAEEAGE